MYFSQKTKLNAILEYQIGVSVSKGMRKYWIKDLLKYLQVIVL